MLPLPPRWMMWCAVVVYVLWLAEAVREQEPVGGTFAAVMIACLLAALHGYAPDDHDGPPGPPAWGS